MVEKTDSVGTKAFIDYCPMCDSHYLIELPHDCAKVEGWNAAIEAAADLVDDNAKIVIIDNIRKLKK